MKSLGRSAPARARWLNRSVLGFGLASFLSDAGHEAASAAMPALLVTLGAAPAVLGMIEGIADGLSSFAKVAGGWLADEPRRRKPIALAGYLLTALSKGAYALATAWPHVAVARTVGWIARGARGPARDAMLADAVPVEARGRAFGFHRALDTAGAVVGPALGMLVLATESLRAVFLWSLVPGLLSVVAFGALVRPDTSPRTREADPVWKSIAVLPSAFRRFLAAVFLFGLGDFARTLLILRATRLLAPEAGEKEATALAIALYVGHNFIYAAASYPVGWAADRVDARRLLMLGYLLGTGTALLAAFATPSRPILVLLFAVAGLTLAFEDTLEGTLTAHLVPPGLRGTGYGVLATTNGLGDLLSSAMVGVLWTTYGPRIAFGAAAVPCLAGALLLLFTGSMRREIP